VKNSAKHISYLIFFKFQAVVQVTVKHFKTALHNIIPSTQRSSDMLVDYKPIKWQEIGGLEEVKIRLKQVK